MHSIQFGNITREFPESISEMTAEQYQYFSFLEMNRQLGKMSMEEVEVLFIYFVLNMERSTNGLKATENINMLRELVRPYYTVQKIKGKNVRILDLSFLENPLPVLNVKTPRLPFWGVKLHGPTAALQDCTYEEVFVHGQNALLEFSSTGDAEALDRLVAILYRPLIKGKKPKFNPEQIDDHLPFVKTLFPEVKFGIYLFFASCQKFITTATDLDIGGGNEVNIAQLFKPDPGQKKTKGIGPVGIIYSLAESGVFGSAKDTASQGVYDVLIRMVQLHEQAKEMKKNAKRK